MPRPLPVRRCAASAQDSTPRLATDPMPWMPFTTDEGIYYPKRGDRAILAYPTTARR